MPTYDYICENCEEIKTENHKMNETPEFFCECGGKMIKGIPQTLNFVLRGDSWAGKNLREKGFREKRHRDLGRKMAKNHEMQNVVPNYKGEVCKSWDEAKMLAKKEGVSEIRYEKQVEHLQKQQKDRQEKVKNMLRGEG